MTSTMKLAALVCFWMFSPEVLILVGNAAGYGFFGSSAVMVILASVIFYGLYLVQTSSAIEEITVTQKLQPGERFISILGFAGIIGTTVFASTGILVTAGFTFNEVFFYRFPNFGFAFLLLAIAFVIQYMSPQRQHLITGALVLAVVFCIVLLIGYGLLSEMPEETFRPPAPEGNSGFSILLSLVFVFIGFEQVNDRRTELVSLPAIAVTLLLAVSLLCGWMFVSARFVEPGRLLLSTIPYMTAAGSITAPAGRYIIGIGIICGSLAAVTALFSISRTFLVVQKLTPLPAGFGKEVPVLLLLTIVLLLSLGLAGSDVLEYLIRVSYVIWVAYGSTIMMMRSSLRKQTAEKGLGFVCGGFMMLCALFAVLQHEKMLYFSLLLLFLALSGLYVLSRKVISRYWGRMSA